MIQSSDQEVVGSHSVQFEQIKTLIQTHNTINGMLTEYLEKMYDTKLANPKDNFLQIADNIECWVSCGRSTNRGIAKGYVYRRFEDSN